MFRSSPAITELALSLAKVIFTLQHLVKLGRYLLCGCVAACHGMACVFYAVQKATGVAFCAEPCVPDSHPYSVTNTRCRIFTVFSPDDGHIFAQNM